MKNAVTGHGIDLVRVCTNAEANENTDKDTMVVGDEFDYVLIDKCKSDPLKIFLGPYKKSVWFTASDPSSSASGAFKMAID